MKKLIALLLALVMVASLAACGAKEAAVEETPKPVETPVETPVEEPAEVPEKEPEEAPVEEKENVTIEAWIVQSDWSEAWVEMEARFEEQYPWIDVQSVGEGEATTEYISGRIAADDLPDVIQVDNNQFWQTVADEGKIADLSGRDVCNYIPESYLNSFTYNGQVLGITQGAAFSVMYFNMQILNEAGWTAPPANWDELLQCCADVQAAGYAPLALTGAYHVGLWMPVELIIANTVGEELGQGVYEDQFMNGKFDFTAYPEIAEKLAALQPYVLIGSASMAQEDLVTVMTDGTAAMCLGGNWISSSMLDGIASCTGDASLAVAALPPFQDAGAANWISVSPETGFGMTVDANRSAAEQEAVEIFFDWLFLPENFMLIQNARGTVPVLGSMTEEHIVLPESIGGILADMNAAPYVKMGFNVYTAVFRDTVVSALCEFLGGGVSAEEIVDLMWQTEQKDYFYN